MPPSLGDDRMGDARHDTAQEADDVRRRLAQIQDALLALPPGPSPERHALLTEQDRLRARARAVTTNWDTARSAEDLRAELDALRAQRAELLRTRSGFATSKGGSNQGPATGAWVKLQRQAMAGGGLDRLTARIAELDDLLAERND